MWKASYNYFVLYGWMQVRIDTGRRTEGLNLHLQGQFQPWIFRVISTQHKTVMHSAFIHKQG